MKAKKQSKSKNKGKKRWLDNENKNNLRNKDEKKNNENKNLKRQKRKSKLETKAKTKITKTKQQQQKNKNKTERKERLRKRAKRSSSAYHWAIFRLHRAELKSLIKWKRKQYFKGLSTTLTENPKRFWAYYQTKYKNKRIPTSLQYNGVKVSDAHEKAELFNNYFNSVFKRDNCVPLHEDYFFSGFDNDNQSLSNITLSPSMVREFLDQLNTTKSWGADEITPRLLKECSKSLSIPLCTLFNKQLDSGCFPKVWKVANLVPVFKSDDREMAQNYRGISFLCIIWKVLEKWVFSYVFPLFQPQMYHLQDGFVSGRSCVTSLLRSTNAFAKALDERKQVETVFFWIIVSI